MAQTINISMVPGLPMPVFNVSQYDTGQSLTVNLKGYTIPSESTITILGTKPSGFGFSVACTYEGSSVTVPVQSTMTEEAGRIPVELRVVKGNKIRGSANFILKVEESPHKENVTDGDAVTAQELTVRMNALEDDVAALESATDVPEGYVPTADGQDGWDWAAQSGGGLTDGIKQALLQIAQKVAYIDEHGQDYYDDLYDALYAVTAISVAPTSVTLQTIGGTQQLTATTTPSGATVTWTSSNTAVATVDSTGLVTSVGYGSATITATAGQLSATCAVVVAQATVTSIDAVYTQSGTVYDTDSLDSLKDDLVVTAHWSNGTTSTVASADYTLSGTLAEGTSTITVLYGGKTTTFDVTATHWEPISVTITWSGSGADKASQVIDATQFDLYYELPFIEGATQYIEGTTADSDAFKTYDVYLYSDAEATNLVGRYQVDTGDIAQSGRAGSFCPNHKFNTKVKVAPRGYFVKLVIMKIVDSFESNANFMSYIQAYGNTATLE